MLLFSPEFYRDHTKIQGFHIQESVSFSPAFYYNHTKIQGFYMQEGASFSPEFYLDHTKIQGFQFHIQEGFLFHQNFSETMLRLESSIKFKTWFKEFSVNNIHVSGTTVLLAFRLAACYLRSIIHQNYSQNVGQSICFNS